MDYLRRRLSENCVIKSVNKLVRSAYGRLLFRLFLLIDLKVSFWHRDPSRFSIGWGWRLEAGPN